MTSFSTSLFTFTGILYTTYLHFTPSFTPALLLHLPLRSTYGDFTKLIITIASTVGACITEHHGSFQHHQYTLARPFRTCSAIIGLILYSSVMTDAPPEVEPQAPVSPTKDEVETAVDVTEYNDTFRKATQSCDDRSVTYIDHCSHYDVKTATKKFPAYALPISKSCVSPRQKAQSSG